MTNYKIILRNVGFVLVIFGLLDIIWMIYCIANDMSYASSFNIFAVIAGVFLIRGNLKATQVIARFAAFFLAGFVGALIITPFILPTDLILAYFKLESASALIVSVLAAVILTLLAWVYKNLTSPPVLAAMDEAKIDYTSLWRRPVSGFLIGSCLILLLLVILSLSTRGATAEQAKQRASAQVGPDFKLYVTSLHTSTTNDGKHIYAVVTAYNDKEIKSINLEWKE